MNNPLAELKDIHVPADLGWWPPAYGWWLLALVVLSLITWLLIFCIKRHQQNLAKRQTLQAVSLIQADSANWPLEFNTLLKRLVQTYQPQLAVQSLHGDKWLDFLSLALPATKQEAFKLQMQTFQHALYQAQPAAQLDFVSSQALVINWIKNAKLTGARANQNLSQWDQQNTVVGGKHV
jgi:hypothetical protein